MVRIITIIIIIIIVGMCEWNCGIVNVIAQINCDQNIFKSKLIPAKTKWPQSMC